ncbi:hypothetical protein PC116_g11447 [Phytophthora cactorum]|nr:hypothetical protein PC116_g11447 [Phytophthora cactorum]
MARKPFKTQRNLSDDNNGVLGEGKKTLLLVVGELTPSFLDRVDMYFKTDNWSVEFYSFRKASEVSDRLRAEYPSRFHSFYMSRSIKNLLKGSPDLTGNEPFVFMNLDSITETLFQSNKLYKKILGASSARDVRINFSALTNKVCGGDRANVKRQVATYATTSPLLAHKLLDLKWEVNKQAPIVMMSSLVETLEQLASSTVPTAQEPKTLVLVMGDRGLTVSNRMMLSDEFLAWKYCQHQYRFHVCRWYQDSRSATFTAVKASSASGIRCNATNPDSATVRTKYQQDIDRQLQQQKSAFELQLREQRSEFDAEYRRLQDDFETRLRDQRDAFTASRAKYEKDIERRLSEMKNGCAGN